MTISSTTRKAGPFNGNGVTTSFPFTFKVFNAGDIAVVRTMPSGIEKTLVLNSDYSVALNGNQDANPGGTITYPISGAPLPDGWRLTAVGDLDNLQPTDITNGGGFYPQVIENALDRVTMLVQQLEEEIGRTIRIAVSDDTTEGLELPAQDGRAARILGFDADGNFTTYERATATVQTTYRKFTATAGQTVFSLPNTYTPGANSLYVWLNGAKLISGTHFTETTSTSFTLTTGAQAGDSIEAIAGVPLANGTVADSSQVSYTPAGAGAVARTAQSRLRDRLCIFDFMTPAEIADVQSGAAVLDHTAAMNAALAEAIARKTILYMPAGTYRHNGRWTHATASYLTIEGDGESTVITNTDRTTNTDWMIHLTGDYITLRNFRVNGEKASLSAPVTERYGVFVDGLWVNLDGVIIHDTINNATSLNGARGVRVSQCTIRDIGYFGAHLNTGGIIAAGLEQTLIVNNFIYRTGRSGIFVFNAKKITVTGNNVDSCENGIRVDKTTFSDPHYATISGNTVMNGTGDGIRFTGNYVTVTGNLCHGNGGSGANADGGNHQTVSGNTLTGNANGIRISDAQGATNRATISGNTCSENSSNGIHLVNPTSAITDLVIVGNNLVGNTDRAIRLANAGAASTLFHANNNYTGGNVIMNGANWTITAPGAYQTTLTAAATITATGAGTHGVSGTVDIDNVTILPIGTEITLYFTGAAAAIGMRDGAGNLRLAGNFLYQANSTIKLVSTGTTWLEVCRSVN